MEKYKSYVIPDNDITIFTNRRWFDKEQTDSVFVVEIKHIPSGMIASSENKSQIKAYNEALKMIEDYILKHNNCQKG